MKSASKATRDPKSLDPEDGWVSRQVVRNAFQHAIRQLEEMLPESQRLPIKESVLELVEGIKFKILKQSKSPADILASIQATKSPQEPTPDQREAHASRLARMRFMDNR